MISIVFVLILFISLSQQKPLSFTEQAQSFLHKWQNPPSCNVNWVEHDWPTGIGSDIHISTSHLGILYFFLCLKNKYFK